MVSLNLEIISPEGVIFSGKCGMTVLPASEGNIGIMPNHEALITTLEKGEIVIYDEKQNAIKTIEIDDGFAEVFADKLVVII
jgi:F-type H+-transporting ATPase subunit epsilon